MIFQDIYAKNKKPKQFRQLLGGGRYST